MPEDHYKILGVCCFIKDALKSFYEAEISGQYQYCLRDRHLERYLAAINGNSFIYQHKLQPIERESIDPTLLYARSLLIQFSRAINYSNLLIYQNLQNGNVWVDITQYSPYSPSYNPSELDPSWWRFDDRSEPALKEINIIEKLEKKICTRNIVLCSSGLQPKPGKPPKPAPIKIERKQDANL